MMSRNHIALIVIFLFFNACKDEKVFVPKPHMYPKIDFPEKGIQTETKAFDCPFTFPLENYSTIVKDSFIFESKTSSDCWFNIEIPELNAKIYCSYYPIVSNNNFDQLVNDAFKIVGEHNTKAEYRKESLIEKNNGVSGLMFEILGPVASPVQFYLTDSTEHFFRASLYFESSVNPDSTAPVLTFLKEDIVSIIDGFEWE